jgi:hypothetical protein
VRWVEVFGDEVVAATMIDRLVHHAEVVALKDDSYRDLGRQVRPSLTITTKHNQGVSLGREGF